MSQAEYNRPLAIVTAGLTGGVRTVIAVVSFATMVFSGPLAQDLASGVGLALFSALAIGSTVAWMSSYEGTIAIPQDQTAAILAVLASSTLALIPASLGREAAFPTIIALLFLSCVATGLFFLGLGAMRLGGLIRFIPFPVIGGVIAGSGWLLTTGAFRVMTGLEMNLSFFSRMARPEVLIQWLPGLLLGAAMFTACRRYRHFMLMPAVLLAGLALFFLTVYLSGRTLADAREMGLMLGPFHKGAMWRSFDFETLGRIHWPALFQALPRIGAVTLVSTLSLLLYASGIEIESECDLDLNQELKAAGVGNLVAALSGGLVGFHSLSLSLMGEKMKVRSRLVGLISAWTAGAAFFFGASAISYFPRPVLGGLLLFLGLDFLHTWAVASRKNLPASEYLVILIILVTVALLGFLEGIAVGILAGVILFVVNYSRIDVVKYAVTGEYYRSNVDRSPPDKKILKEKGAQLWVLRLQGFIFFGTANNLLRRVRRRIFSTKSRPLKYLLLDFSSVGGIDSSAVMSFIRMRQLASSQGVVIGLVSLTEQIRDQMENGGFFIRETEHLQVFEDLDRGLECFEDRLLSEVEIDGKHKRDPLVERLKREFGDPDLAEKFMSYLTQEDFRQGQTLIIQDEEDDNLLFIEWGQVTAVLQMEGGRTVRLRTMGAGTVVGELGLYLNAPRTASIVAETDGALYRLNRESLARMEKDESLAASAFHHFMVRLLAERLADTNKMLRIVLD